MLTYTLIENDGERSLLVLSPGYAPLVVAESHPYFEAILDGARAGDESVYELADLGKTAATRFERLSDRVTVSNGAIFFDGVEVDNALTETLLRFIEAGVEDWQPLVNFYEKVETNPNSHSREQLYTWLANQEFSITEDGDIVGYKGVRPTADGGYESIHSGKAIVNGEVVTGCIPNAIGSVIEMPRDQVQFDPGVGCHTGLHVGTFEYAAGFAQGALLEVVVNPRDVVSVPTDCGAQKMRTCRYKVVGLLEQRLDSPLRVYDQAADEYDFAGEGWGDFEDDEDYLY
jgi:hypothetical protein